jgi:hypothetical protein
MTMVVVAPIVARDAQGESKSRQNEFFIKIEPDRFIQP